MANPSAFPTLRTLLPALAAALPVLIVPTELSAQEQSHGAWSAPVDGLRGRLIATSFDSTGSRVLRIDLELENVRDVMNPLGITWGSLGQMLRFQLTAADGAEMPRLRPGGNELVPPPYRLTLPYHSSIRVLVSANALERNTTQSTLWLRPVVFQAFDLTAFTDSTVRLSAVLTPLQGAGADKDTTWQGSLSLPPVTVQPTALDAAPTAAPTQAPR